MASTSLTTNTQNKTENTEVKNDTNQWGQVILNAKTSLIKPYSKYTQEGLRPRTPNDPYTILTKKQESSVESTASPLFWDTSRSLASTGVSRRFRQRHTDSLPISHLRTSGNTHFTYITPHAYTSQLPERYNGCTADGYPKWYPNRAGKRTLPHLSGGELIERSDIPIDMLHRVPTARTGQIIFDHGRPNNGYYLPRNALNDTTWFGSDIELNRHHILDSIQSKTFVEYEKEKSNRQDQYQKAKEKWPHLSEYGEQFVLGTTVEQRQKTDLERAKEHVAQNPTRLTSFHNQLVASAIAQGRTLINDPSLIVKC